MIEIHTITQEQNLWNETIGLFDRRGRWREIWILFEHHSDCIIRDMGTSGREIIPFQFRIEWTIIQTNEI